MDDEVIGSYGEIAGLDVNAKLFAQLLGGRSALRHFLDSPDTLVGEIAEQHVRGHGSPPLTKKAVDTEAPSPGHTRQFCAVAKRFRRRSAGVMLKGVKNRPP